MKILIRLLLSILISHCASANSQLYKSFRVGLDEGISNCYVNSVCRDHLGYVWVGTQHGLNRFDGFETEKYFNDKNDQSTISSNWINRVYEDWDGDMWISSGNGWDIFDRNNESFKKIFGGKSNVPELIYEDEKYVWFVNSSFTLLLYNKTTGNVHSDPIVLKNEEDNPSQMLVQKACDYNAQYLLLAIAGKGLYLLDKENKVAEEYYKFPIYRFTGLEVVGEQIWVASRFGGIYKKHKKRKKAVHYGLNDYGITSVLDLKIKPKTNTICISTDGKGVFEFSQDFELINHLTAGADVNQPLSDNSVLTIYFEDNGNMWLGTVRAGALLLYPSSFIHFPFTYGKNSGPSNRTVLRLHEDGNGGIWFGTDGGGLNKFDPSDLDFSAFTRSNYDKISGIVSFSENILLISMFRQRLYFYNTVSNTFYDAHSHPLLKDIGLNKQYRLFKDSENNLWVWDDRLWKINIEKEEVEIFGRSNKPNLFNQLSALFNSVYEDKKNRVLWFGVAGGFFAYDLKNKEFSDINTLNNARGSFGRGVYCIIKESNGHIVFGTSNGLYKYDTNLNLVSNYYESAQFHNTIFYSLWEVDSVLWAATSEGIWKLESNNSIIKLQEGRHEFRENSVLQTSEGKVYLGTNNGLVSFYPELIMADTLAKSTVITSFISSGTARDSEPDHNHIHEYKKGDEFKIPYSSSVLRISFNSFDIPYHEKTQYSYLLEGFEEYWNTGKERQATYTNLLPGDYVFHVKSSTSTGNWDGKTTQIKFKILPPWWQTIWVKVLVIVTVLGLATFIWKELLERAKLKHLVKVEKQLVQAEKNEKKRLKEVNQMKLRFFTNISHELRTPLTLIYAPLKKMVGAGAPIEEIKKGLPGIFRNAERMKLLVDQILEFRRSEMDELKLNVKNTDFIVFCRKIIDSFYFMAETEEIKLRFIHDDASLYFNFDRDKFTKILYNLISNAFKHTPKGGEIELKVIEGEEQITILVSDTGNGVEESKLETIFERYYQGVDEIEGTGIGLALAKSLVSLHNGEIWAENRPEGGAVFCVEIPKRFEIKDETYEGSTLEDIQPMLESKSVIAEKIREHDHNISILIVEDDWELRNYLATVFGRSYKIYTASNGKVGLHEALEKLPDIIITDIMMPELNGFEFCKALKSDLRISHIPVVMLTAKTLAANEIEGYRSGADLYIAKPFDEEILQTQVDALLSNRDLLKERFGHGTGLVSKEFTYSEPDEKLLLKAISIVEMNMVNVDFDVNAFVELLGISRTLAYKKIKAISGKAINDFIQSVRLQKAKVLMINSNKSINEIALEVGFAEPSYFSAVFKKHFNVSPSEFRQNYSNE